MFAKNPPLSLQQLFINSVASVGCYHGAMLWQPLAGWFVLGYLAFLWQLRRAETARAGFYFGWLVGLGIMVPQTWFVFGIFSWVAVALWLLMSIWLGLVVAVWQAGSRRWGNQVMIWLAPLTMLGVEYFRSEVWPLKFTWDTAGFALPAADWGVAFWCLGIYGLGAVLLTLVILARTRTRIRLLAALPLLAWPLGRGRLPDLSTGATLAVAGLQWEKPTIESCIKSLDEALAKHPETQLFVFSEYSFPGPPTEEISAWAKAHNRYVMTGGVDMVPGQKFDKFYNTAFLTGPDGAIIHRQVKAVPIQFMDDGMPAPSQAVWPSPQGPIGVCICYDMNYTKVTDELVRQGATALVIPAMDLKDWGYAEHVLSARLGATRSAEYGLPLFRLASSGISQLIQPGGHVVVESTFPGQGEIVAGKLNLAKGGHLPLDRWLAWPAMIVTAGALLWLMWADVRRRWLF